MPPGHHSSSHHSSSHHSSSHHSSSHHSSSHHSSSYHSSSHYNSTRSNRSSGSYSSGSRSPYENRSLGSSVVTFSRPRTNQPSGYKNTVRGYKPATRYHCKKHDYVYFPIDWIDEDTNTAYKSGYYDEDGTYYESVGFSNGTQSIAKYHCEYCESDYKLNWKEGQKPVCPNCGATLEVAHSIQDEILNEQHRPGSSTSPVWPPLLKLIVFLVSGSVFVIFFIAFELIWNASNTVNESSYNVEVVESNTDLYGDEYYVEEIGRSCEWDDETESYYDPVTGCYFWYNNEYEPASWQYWYEDISSDYPDSGWMEYDKMQKCWYIEADYDEWIVLPDKYDTSYLWHINQ